MTEKIVRKDIIILVTQNEDPCNYDSHLLPKENKVPAKKMRLLALSRERKS